MGNGVKLTNAGKAEKQERQEGQERQENQAGLLWEGRLAPIP
jgi:hypothetical protein